MNFADCMRATWSATPHPKTRLWLYARNDLLGGKTAIELIHEDRTDEVLQAIERLDSLAYL